MEKKEFLLIKPLYYITLFNCRARARAREHLYLVRGRPRITMHFAFQETGFNKKTPQNSPRIPRAAHPSKTI